MKTLKKLYSIHSKSGNEGNMRKYIMEYCSKIENTKVVSDNVGNVYVTKGKSDIYPCIASHIDQVQTRHANDFQVYDTGEILFGYSPSHREQQGLGADDKNGIWIALKCLKKYDCIKCAFFVGEEIGCVGSHACDIKFFDDCRFVVQCDRRGNSDFITDISWTSLCSEQFVKDAQIEKFGYHEESGMMTDVETLRDRGVICSCCNMSCGYYNPHTDEEITHKGDLLNCLALVEHIIENCTADYTHIAESKYSGYYDDFYYGHTKKRVASDLDAYLYDEMFEMIEAYPELTFDEYWQFYADKDISEEMKPQVEDIFKEAQADVEYYLCMNDSVM